MKITKDMIKLMQEYDNWNGKEYCTKDIKKNIYNKLVKLGMNKYELENRGIYGI